MSDDSSPIELLSTTLFEKQWGVVLPSSVVDIFDALLSEGSHVRLAIDARLRHLNAYPEGLESSVWEEPNPWPNQEALPSDGHARQESTLEEQETELVQRRNNEAAPKGYLAEKKRPVTLTLAGLLDLLVACEVVTLDSRGEYSLNPLAPHALEALSAVDQ